MAAVLAWAKRMPETTLHEPPRHWNFPWPRLDAVAGSTLALVGLGGIGAAIARRALAFDMRVRALRRTDAPSPVAGVEIVRSLEALVDGAGSSRARGARDREDASSRERRAARA